MPINQNDLTKSTNVNNLNGPSTSTLPGASTLQAPLGGAGAAPKDAGPAAGGPDPSEQISNKEIAEKMIERNMQHNVDLVKRELTSITN